MYIIAIAWIYVTLMMAVAEATSSNGTVMGAIVTFALYGMLPVSILVYIMSTPARKRAIKAREAAEQADYDAQHAVQTNAADPQDALTDALQDTPQNQVTQSVAPDASGKAPAPAEGSTVAPVRKEL